MLCGDVVVDGGVSDVEGSGKGKHKFLLVDRRGDLSSNNYHFEKLSLAPRSSYPDMKSPFNVWYVVF